jgi:hypothetical protein
MPDFVTLSCPSCGGKLQITNNIERFACGYCGNEHVVRRGGGIISLIPVAEDIKGIKTGVDKTAAELAIIRLDKEINELNQKIKTIRQDIQKKYEAKDTKYSPFMDSLMDDLVQKRDGIKIPNFMPNKITQLYKNRWLAITIEDIDYLIVTAIPFHMQHGGGMLYIEILDDLRSLKKVMLASNNIITKNEAEIAKLKQLVSS